MCLVTFVVPSVGRKTLANTVATLYEQTNSNWNAVVVFDDVEPTIQTNSKIIALKTPVKLGKGHNSAGEVRNFGIKHMIEHKLCGEWIAFVDDDDCITSDYVQLVKSEIEDAKFWEKGVNLTEGSLTPDVILFKMQYTSGLVLPKDMSLKISQMENGVGISYCFKKSIFDRFNFIPSSGEDFNMLKRFEDQGLVILKSNNITYKVSPLGIAEDRR